MNLLRMLGLGKRRDWQELVGNRPHMIDESSVEGGYGKGTKYSIENRIAVVSVRGLLVNDEDYWDGWEVSTYNRISRDVMTAADDPNVDGIMLAINSPGGETDNAFETADKIVAASKKKPVWAVAETSAFSAGYLLASSGSRVYVPQYSGGVGSIGVYSVHMDYSEMLADAGIKATFFEAGKGKTDGHPLKPLGAAGKQRLQSMIDKSYTQFVDHVSLQRGIPAGTIREELGADLFSGKDAIQAGLADKVGDTETALAEMRSYLDTRAAATVPLQATNTATDIQSEAAPALIVAETVDDDPVVAEREASERAERIRALCATHGAEQEAEAFIASAHTAEQVAAQLLERRAAASEQSEIVSQMEPHTAASVETKVDESALVRSAEKRAEKFRRERGGR